MTQCDEGIVGEHHAALRVPADHGERVVGRDERGARKRCSAHPDEAMTGSDGAISRLDPRDAACEAVGLAEIYGGARRAGGMAAFQSWQSFGRTVVAKDRRTDVRIQRSEHSHATETRTRRRAIYPFG